MTAVGRALAPKLGWTDVARFSELGIPAVNFGSGGPALSHADDEQVLVAEIDKTYRTLRSWPQKPQR